MTQPTNQMHKPQTDSLLDQCYATSYCDSQQLLSLIICVLMFVKWFATAIQEQSRSQVTKLVSGDDLEDDFVLEDDSKDKDSKKTKTDPFQTNHTQAKLKKTQGPKVVNFVG